MSQIPFQNSPNDAYLLMQQSAPGVDGPAALLLKKQLDGTHAPVVALPQEQIDAIKGAGTSTATPTTPAVAKVSFATFTSVLGAQTLSIPAGALEISIANTGSADATFTTASMTPATTVLKPVTDPDGAALNFVAPTGYTLEAMTVVAPVGVTIDYMIIKG